MRPDPDAAVRATAFAELERLVLTRGPRLPWRAIDRGFSFDGQRVRFAGRATGIFKPRQVGRADRRRLQRAAGAVLLARCLEEAQPPSLVQQPDQVRLWPSLRFQRTDVVAPAGGSAHPAGCRRRPGDRDQRHLHVDPPPHRLRREPDWRGHELPRPRCEVGPGRPGRSAAPEPPGSRRRAAASPGPARGSSGSGVSRLAVRALPRSRGLTGDRAGKALRSPLRGALSSRAGGNADAPGASRSAGATQPVSRLGWALPTRTTGPRSRPR